MSIESSIISRLRESRNQEFMTYKGFSISVDYDNNVIVSGSRGKMGEFMNTEDAMEFIDNLPASQRRPSTSRTPNKTTDSKNKYLIFMKGSYYDSRAQFLTKKSRRCEWKYASEADQFTEKERNAILARSRNYDSILVR